MDLARKRISNKSYSGVKIAVLKMKTEKIEIQISEKQKQYVSENVKNLKKQINK